MTSVMGPGRVKWQSCST